MRWFARCFCRNSLIIVNKQSKIASENTCAIFSYNSITLKGVFNNGTSSSSI